MPMSAERISEKIVGAPPGTAKGNKLHYLGRAHQGKKSAVGFAVRVTSAGTKSFVWFPSCRRRALSRDLGGRDENT